MAMKIRLARGGSNKRPFYSIVAADSRMPRDGRFIEKLGVYQPLLPKDSEDRVRLDLDKVKAWLDKGAQPTDRVSRMLEAAGVVGKKTRANLKKGTPGEAAKKLAEEKAAKAAAPAEEAPAAAAPAEDVAADEPAAEATEAAETASE
jgi:small subunit ribosomal protein S16